MTDVIWCFQAQLEHGEESSSLHWSSPQGCGSREDAAGAGAEPPTRRLLLRQEHGMDHKRVGLTQTCPSAVGISLVFQPEHKKGDARGRQAMRSCSNSAGASLQGSIHPGCLRHTAVMPPPCHCTLASFLKHLHMQHALELKNH